MGTLSDVSAFLLLLQYKVHGTAATTALYEGLKRGNYDTIKATILSTHTAAAAMHAWGMIRIDCGVRVTMQQAWHNRGAP